MRLLVRKQASIVAGGYVDARNISAAITSHPRAEIVASCAAQRAATPVNADAETALLLYDRYFFRVNARPASDLAGLPPRRGVCAR